MHKDMYAKISKCLCLLVVVEEGIQLWSGIQNTVYAWHGLHKAEGNLQRGCRTSNTENKVI